MGVRKLHDFIKKRSRELNTSLYDVCSMSTYANKRIAVDTILYLYKFKSTRKHQWMSMFLKFIQMFLRYSIYPVFIFDTQAPIEKQKKQQERRERRESAYVRIDKIRKSLNDYKTSGTIDPILEQISKKNAPRLLQWTKSEEEKDLYISEEAIAHEIRMLENQSISISKRDVDLVRTLLNGLGIPYLNATSEGETLCAQLAITGQVDYVLSDDTDVLVYGTPAFLTKLDIMTERVYEFRIQHILDVLHWTQEQFRDFCILCGTDYNSNIPHIACEKAYHYINKYPSIESMMEAVPKYDYSVLNYERVRTIFTITNEQTQELEWTQKIDEEIIDSFCQSYPDVSAMIHQCVKLRTLLMG